MGFHVRKHFKNEKKKKGGLASRGFVCGNEGHHKIDKRSHEVKRHRAETRTGCVVCLHLKLISVLFLW
jgi:zinc finger SWIM domain-containing protein 3